jgi:hypothetical protein
VLLFAYNRITTRGIEALHRLVQAHSASVQVRVGLIDRRVAEHIADLMQRPPGLEQPARALVAEIVEVQVGDPRPYAGVQPRPLRILDLLAAIADDVMLGLVGLPRRVRLRHLQHRGEARGELIRLATARLEVEIPAMRALRPRAQRSRRAYGDRDSGVSSFCVVFLWRVERKQRLEKDPSSAL